ELSMFVIVEAIATIFRRASSERRELSERIEAKRDQEVDVVGVAAKSRTHHASSAEPTHELVELLLDSPSFGPSIGGTRAPFKPDETLSFLEESARCERDAFKDRSEHLWKTGRREDAGRLRAIRSAFAELKRNPTLLRAFPPTEQQPQRSPEHEVDKIPERIIVRQTCVRQHGEAPSRRDSLEEEFAQPVVDERLP